MQAADPTYGDEFHSWDVTLADSDEAG